MPLTELQHKERASGLGASDAAVAMGLSTWKTPLELYLEKTGEVVPDDISEKPLIKWGNRLEEVIAKGWSEDTGIKVARVNESLRHPEHDFMLCHLDYRQVGKKRVLECKNTGQWYGQKAFGESGSDVVPDNYLIQVHHQIIITNALHGWTGGELIALIGGNDLRTYSFEYDAELSELIINKLAAFWALVKARTPPAATTVDDLTLLYAQDNGEMKNVDASVFDLFQKYHELNDQAKTYTKALDSVKDDLRFAIAEAAGIKLNDITEGPEHAAIQYAGKALATWKTQTARRIDTPRLKAERPEIYDEFVKVGTSRVLRVQKQ